MRVVIVPISIQQILRIIFPEWGMVYYKLLNFQLLFGSLSPAISSYPESAYMEIHYANSCVAEKRRQISKL